MIGHVEHNRSALLYDGLVKAAKTLNVSIDYLAGLTDDPTPSTELREQVDEMAANRLPPNDLADNAALVHLNPAGPCSHGYRMLQRRGAKLAAGYGAFIESEPVIGHLAFREDWLLKHGINHEKADIVEVMGQSMEPTLPDGALILVDYQRTRRRLNRIFVVRSDDLVLIKRLVKDRQGKWLLVSDNKEYTPLPWPREGRVIGQVMWTGRTL